ncbi:MAG: bi-domain-containing oxidoreductase [Gemmatimonadales bacterium]|jgi:predicted dehydrogenase/threonine dehydrogenase-like Zn-dependent dehydrogenase|nr:bi-domain-containing oxidoreductase [Gemmatimonadales bacterium]
MKQLLQRLDSGTTALVDAPVPAVAGARILVESRASLISPGTERMLVDFGRAGLLEKARQQPDRVKQVLEKVRTDGLGPTLDAVRAKLSVPIPLGYCQAGVVVATGSADGPFRPGDRVVTNGPHAEYVRVPVTLAARIPDGVGFEAAAFTPLAAIGLQGLRLANPTIGETVVVFGLGLIGLLTVQLARAAGCTVIGIDRVADRLALAERFGATAIDGSAADVVASVLARSGGTGADAVLLTLASSSDEPVQQAAEMARARGRLVLVGTTGLALRREAFYRKELTFQVSCSYGPGRYDSRYEEDGADYPLPYVRWTAARNFAAVLELMAGGRLDPAPFVSHRVPFERAPEAYDELQASRGLGIVLQYPDRGGAAPPAEARTVVRPAAGAAGRAVAVVGAGNFASRTLLPELRAAGFRLHTLVTSGGPGGAAVAERFGFERYSTDLSQALDDPAIDTVFLLTRHDLHARQACRALEVGKHVFVEKPLALTLEELEAVARAAEAGPGLLMVGFNRRFAPLAADVRDRLSQRGGPAALVLTVNAGALPADHWTRDVRVGGGRIVGEACHFIDLARYLVGAPISGLQVTAARDRAGRPVDDIAHLALAFEDGSTAVVHYLANGPTAFPKERIEAFADGAGIRIDNWRRLEGFGRGPTTRWPKRMDKGHGAEVVAWARALRGEGPAPIALGELLEVSRWAIRAGELARGLG